MELADRYALIKSQVEALQAELAKVREEILASGQEAIVGEKSVILVKLSDRKTVDWAAAAKKYLDTTVRDAAAVEFEKVTKNIATLTVNPNLNA